MDLNYMLRREQYALYMAEASRSACARITHRAFANAYGALIARSGFPHSVSSAPQRSLSQSPATLQGEARVNVWESEGGSLRPSASSLGKADSNQFALKSSDRCGS